MCAYSVFTRHSTLIQLAQKFGVWTKAENGDRKRRIRWWTEPWIWAQVINVFKQSWFYQLMKVDRQWHGVHISCGWSCFHVLSPCWQRTSALCMRSLRICYMEKKKKSLCRIWKFTWQKYNLVRFEVTPCNDNLSVSCVVLKRTLQELTQNQNKRSPHATKPCNKTSGQVFFMSDRKHDLQPPPSPRSTPSTKLFLRSQSGDAR